MIGLQATLDDIVHWTYLMAGQLTVCGVLGEPMRDTDDAPTCVRCIALVQAGKQGDQMFWASDDPTRKLG